VIFFVYGSTTLHLGSRSSSGFGYFYHQKS